MVKNSNIRSYGSGKLTVANVIQEVKTYGVILQQNWLLVVFKFKFFPNNNAVENILFPITITTSLKLLCLLPESLLKRFIHK
jgi:hypothetical protein